MSRDVKLQQDQGQAEDDQAPQITLEDKASRQEQIQQILTVAQERKEPVRIRLPVFLYENGQRSYVQLRERTWNLTLASDETTVEQVEVVLEGLGLCIKTLVTLGVAETERRLRREGEA